MQAGSMRTLLCLVIAFLITLPLRGAGHQSNPENLQVFLGQIMDSYCAKNGSHDDMMEQMKSMGRDPRTCTIKCVELGAKLVLYDSARHTTYKIENPEKTLPFAGQHVRVTGKLQKNQITVTAIENVN